MYTPEAFAPKVDETGAAEKGSDYNENRAYATQPKYPLTSTSHESENASEMAEEKSIGHSIVGKMNDEQLLVANFGADDEDGFEVCTDCGAVSREGRSRTHTPVHTQGSPICWGI